jgi:hypothetical protein
MTDVFICYSRRDLEFVRSLAEALRERAADTFLDLGEWWYDDGSREQSANSGDVSAMGSPDRALSRPASDSAVASENRTGLEAGYELNAGARMDEVHAAITGATSVLAVVSPDLAASARCRHELERAAVLHKHIVAVSARPTPSASLPPQLRQCELFALAAEDFENGVGRLVRALEGDSPRVSVWASLHRRRWTLLGIMALTFLGLGLWGYTDLYPTLPFVDRLYVALALFRDNTTIYSQSAPKAPMVPPFPWPLEVARWFAPLTLVLAGLSAIFAVLAEPFNRLRIHAFYRRHLVVCGLGAFGLRLASAFQARGERVVAVDANPSSVALSRCRELSVPVLVGDATDPEVLRRAGLERATRIVAVCGDNSVNDRIGVAAKRVVTSEKRPRNRRRRLDCFVHVDDDQMCQRLEQSSLADTDKRGVTLSYVNVFRAGGLALLGQFPHSFVERDGTVPHIVVVGTDRVGLLLVVGAVKEWWFDHRGDGLRLELTLVAADAKQRIRTLRRRYPHFEEACDLAAVPCDPADPDSSELPSLVHDGRGRTTVFVSYADERAGLEAVMQVSSHTPSEVPIVALTTGQTGPVTILDRAATQLHLSNVTTFPLLDRLCRPDVFVNSVTEQMARALHGNYLRHRRLDGTYDPARESHKPWEVLSETFRESNRDSAMHLSGRLDAAGYSVQVSDDWATALPVLTEEEVARLAESEHGRWCEERLADGWTYAAETDLARKRHTDLVPWDDLGESRKELDREAQRELPVLLARYGLAIVRKSPPLAKPPAASA